MSSMTIVNLSPETRGVMGLSFMEPDPQYLQPGSEPQGRLVAKALNLALNNGYWPRAGNELKVVAEEGEIQKIFLDEQELVIG